VMFRNELSEFMVENGVWKGPLKRNRIKYVISATWYTCTVMLLYGSTHAHLTTLEFILCCFGGARSCSLSQP